MAVQLAHRVAMESTLITSDMVEATEFLHLAHKYNVAAVPKTVINETIEFEGVLLESEFFKVRDEGREVREKRNLCDKSHSKSYNGIGVYEVLRSKIWGCVTNHKHRVI